MSSLVTSRWLTLNRRASFCTLLTLLYVCAIFYLIDLRDLTAAMVRIPGPALAAGALLVIFSNFFALARAGTILRAMGIRIAWRDVAVAFGAGNVANLPLNVIGQSVTRATVLARAGVPYGATIMATYMERLLAAGLLFLFALAALWILFGRIDFRISSGGGILLSTVAAMAVTGAGVAMTVFRRQIRAHGRACLRWTHNLGPSALLTVLCHASALGAYLVLLNGLKASAASVDLIAAITIVMFVTSLPISFSGWGLRELSAASTLGMIGLAPEVSVVAAVAIGLLFLAATGLFAGLGMLLSARGNAAVPAGHASSAPEGRQTPAFNLQGWDARTVQGCAILCAVFLMFRIQTVFVNNTIPVNVNVADIFVFLGLSVMVLMIAAGRLRSLFPPFLNLSLAVLSVVIVGGLLNSYFSGGLGGWAFYTRGVGWILMLGYAALGAAMVGLSGAEGRMVILRSLIVAGMAICVVQLLLLSWSTFVTPIPPYVLVYPIEGYTNNQNAFCFELAMIATLLVVARCLGLFRDREWWYAAALAVLTLTIYFTASRTGIVFIVMLAVLDHLICRKWAGARSGFAPSATRWAAIALVATLFLPYIQYFAVQAVGALFGLEIDSAKLFADLVQPDAWNNTRFLHPASDIQRWETIVGGLELWTAHPLFGAGIGTYIESRIASGGIVHAIHSTYVWFLAEMGIAGLAVALASAFLIAAHAWHRMAQPASAPWGFAMFAILAFMAVGSLVQDFFFQRIFWFLLGLAAADGAGPWKQVGSDPRIFLTVVLGLTAIVFLLAL